MKKNQIRKSVAALAMAAVVSVSLRLRQQVCLLHRRRVR